MKLFSSPASPFATKVEMVAHLLGIKLDIVPGDVANQADGITSANPLCKVPCLVIEDGSGLFDSRTITRYLNRHAGGKLFPADDPELLAAERMESLADGICDAAVAIRFEAAFRPAEKVHKPWQERQWDKVTRGLDLAMTQLPPSGSDAHVGSVALAATVGYLELRYPGQWEEGRDKLIEWNDAFFASHGDLLALKPSL